MNVQVEARGIDLRRTLKTELALHRVAPPQPERDDRQDQADDGDRAADVQQRVPNIQDAERLQDE